jgi:hypothetical protein
MPPTRLAKTASAKSRNYKVEYMNGMRQYAVREYLAGRPDGVELCPNEWYAKRLCEALNDEVTKNRGSR